MKTESHDLDEIALLLDYGGGPAFPSSAETPEGKLYHYGMSLRDWFAGQALLLKWENKAMTPEQIAKRAYKMADALLAEREKSAT